MSHQETSQESTGQYWEQSLIDDYCDYRWHKILDPLCDTFQRWKDGKLTYEDVDQAIDTAYSEKCGIKNLFAQRMDRAWTLIQWWDREWFESWVEEHRPPADIEMEP